MEDHLKELIDLVENKFKTEADVRRKLRNKKKSLKRKRKK